MNHRLAAAIRGVGALACVLALAPSIDVSVEGNAIHIVYSGTVDKDSMKGTAQFGDLADGTFTAKRKP